LKWFNQLVESLFLDENLVSKGIPLQLCDVFLRELNSADGKAISNEHISLLLEPFLKALASCSNLIILGRIKEKVFLPILENNILPEEEIKDEEIKEEEEVPNGKWVDGGRLSKKT
jgi:hypothetical protein